MRARVLTLRFSSTLGGFDDSVVQEFIGDKELISLREYFYQVHEIPHLSLILCYQEPHRSRVSGRLERADPQHVEPVGSSEAPDPVGTGAQ